MFSLSNIPVPLQQNDYAGSVPYAPIQQQNATVQGALPLLPSPYTNTYPALGNTLPPSAVPVQLTPSSSLNMSFQDMGVADAVLPSVLNKLLPEEATMFNNLQQQRLQILTGIGTLPADRQQEAVNLFLHAKTLQFQLIQKHIEGAGQVNTSSALQTTGVSSNTVQPIISQLKPQDVQKLNVLQIQKLQLLSSLTQLPSQQQQQQALQAISQAEQQQQAILNQYVKPQSQIKESAVPLLMMALLGKPKKATSTSSENESAISSSSTSVTETTSNANHSSSTPSVSAKPSTTITSFGNTTVTAASPPSVNNSGWTSSSSSQTTSSSSTQKSSSSGSGKSSSSGGKKSSSSGWNNQGGGGFLSGLNNVIQGVLSALGF